METWMPGGGLDKKQSYYDSSVMERLVIKNFPVLLYSGTTDALFNFVQKAIRKFFY